MPDFLLELAVEEIPARFLDRALPALVDLVTKGLAEAALPAREVRGAATPRRLVVHARGLPERQPDQREEKVGPREEAAYKDGKPTVAAEKFAQSMGLTLAQCTVQEVTKGKTTARYLFAVREVTGRPALTVLAERIPAWIEAIPFAKSMRWVPGSKARFARPLRGICALLDRTVVSVEWCGVKSGRTVQGHRFLAPAPLELADADWGRYVGALRQAKVLVDPAERRARIVEGLTKHIGAAGLAQREKLVAEVTNLVEWPVVDVGSFDARYLGLPPIVVISAMTGHQRYFPITEGPGTQAAGEQGKLAPRFAYVANRELDPVIRRGNERVLAARLSDAHYFFQLDQKRPLNERVEQLEQVVFMQELGSYKARIERIDALALEAADGAGWIPREQNEPGRRERPTTAFSPTDQLALHIHLAARLQRADLTTEVVQEFPDLQGEMGAIYARLQDLHEDVAAAIREAYLPRGEGDVLPATKAGICLALADKTDTIVAAFATGRGPTGSKDPFMVRRSVLGVLRILRERQLDMGFGRLLQRAIGLLPDALRKDGLRDEIQGYFRDRLEVLAREAGFHHQLVRAAMASGVDPTHVLDFWTRLGALQALARDERFPRLCELVERSRNITAKNGPEVDPEDVDSGRLAHPAERALHQAIQGCRRQVESAIAGRRYEEAGRLYVESLAGVTHTFFEPAPRGVFVMDEDARLRRNRLALLKQVHGLLAGGFADLAQVDVKALTSGSS